jgi:hypothetical protein
MWRKFQVASALGWLFIGVLSPVVGASPDTHTPR